MRQNVLHFYVPFLFFSVQVQRSPRNFFSKARINRYVLTPNIYSRILSTIFKLFSTGPEKIFF